VHTAGAGGLLAGAVGEGALELEESAGDLVLHGGLAPLVVDGGGDGSVVGARGGVVGAAGGPATSGEEAAARGACGAGGVGGVVVTRSGGHGGTGAAGGERHDGGWCLVKKFGGGWLFGVDLGEVGRYWSVGRV
jgi:hypothetical protein